MARRPEGTDGSDHAFRERVEDLYKGMPVWRAAGWLLLHFTSIPIALKLAWGLTPHYLLGASVNITSFSVAGIYVAALLFWTLGRPAHAKENLNLLKLTNICVIMSLGLHFITLYKQYNLDRPQDKHWRIVWKHLKDERGWAADHWQYTLGNLDAAIDIILLLMLAATAFTLHGFLMRKMSLEKRLKRDKKTIAAGTAGMDGSGQQAPSRASPSTARRRRA